ncbi:MAG: PEP-CTERM sorting domain-containing protein [Chitinivibrionales bacterium]|nr:PEP-CTERM sorting domain-containing protein [Chitinivibrionales bacterium]
MSAKIISITATMALAILFAHAKADIITYSDFAVFDGAADIALAEDFESVPVAYNTALSSFSNNGLTYSGVSSSPFSPNVWIASPGYTNFGIPGPTTSSILTATGNEDFLVIDVAPDQTAIGFNTYLNDFGDVTVTVTEIDGQVTVFDYYHDPEDVGFLGVIADDAIASLQWTAQGGEKINTGIDNVYAGTTPVPEPATISLLGFSLCALALYRRRKR